MKRILIALCLVSLNSAAFAGIVDDAKKQIAKEKQESLVAKAKTLLEKKAKLESDLETVKKKLSKLDGGEDIEVSEPPTLGWSTFRTHLVGEDNN